MKKILIVADNPKSALALAVRLKAHGYATWIAADAIQGMKAVVRHQPDLIFLEITQPSRNSFDMADRLNQLKRSRAMPLMMSNWRRI